MDGGAEPMDGGARVDDAEQWALGASAGDLKPLGSSGGAGAGHAASSEEADGAFLANARHGHLSLLRDTLSALGAPERSRRLRAEDSHGNTALLLAIIFEWPSVASVLLQYPETDPMHMNKQGHTALSLAARTKRQFVVGVVLRRLLSIDRLDRGVLVTFPMLAQMTSAVTTSGGGSSVSFALARRNLIDVYADLSLDALALCVVRHFTKQPCQCLFDCVELASAIQLRSRSVRHYDSFRSDELEASSAQVQLCLAGCLCSLCVCRGANSDPLHFATPC